MLSISGSSWNIKAAFTAAIMFQVLQQKPARLCDGCVCHVFIITGPIV